jgi:hypothetical protein
MSNPTRGSSAARIAGAALAATAIVGLAGVVAQSTGTVAGHAHPAADSTSPVAAVLTDDTAQQQPMFAKKKPRNTSRGAFELGCMGAGGTLTGSTLVGCTVPNGNSAVWHGDGTYTVTYPDGIEIDY